MLVLEIMQVMLSDSGLYMCIATVNGEEIVESFSLDVKDYRKNPLYMIYIYIV